MGPGAHGEKPVARDLPCVVAVQRSGCVCWLPPAPDARSPCACPCRGARPAPRPCLVFVARGGERVLREDRIRTRAPALHLRAHTPPPYETHPDPRILQLYDMDT